MRCGNRGGALANWAPVRDVRRAAGRHRTNGRRRHPRHDMLYRWKVRALKVPRLNAWWRRFVARRGQTVGSYGDLPSYIRRLAPGKSFADIGCLWGVNGEYAFIAEEAGATKVTAVDVFGPTPEFEVKKAQR